MNFQPNHTVFRDPTHGIVGDMHVLKHRPERRLRLVSVKSRAYTAAAHICMQRALGLGTRS
jgi:hypothetical protein